MYVRNDHTNTHGATDLPQCVLTPPRSYILPWQWSNYGPQISSIFQVVVYKEIFFLKILFAFLVFDILGAYESHRNLSHFIILTSRDLHKPHSSWLYNTHPGHITSPSYSATFHYAYKSWWPLSSLCNVGIQKVKGAEVLLHVMKAYGGVVVYLHSFLTSEVGATTGASGQIEAPDRNTPLGKIPRYPLTRRLRRRGVRSRSE